MSHPFEVGKTYRNRVGEYVVQAIDGARMTIRYVDGGVLVTDVQIQARIWENIQSERRVARAEERQRQAREARTAARQRTAQARRARTPPAFGGFQESDFEPKERGIAWSGRKELGKLLAYALGQRGQGAFGYWIVPLQSEVQIARTEHYNRDARERNAAFFVAAGEKGVSYGLRVGRPSGQVKAEWPWSAFVAALEGDAPLREGLRSAMSKHRLSLDVYAMEARYGRVGRITVQESGFLWQHETAEQGMTREMDWAQLVEYLRTVTPGKRCNLYLRKHVSAATALKAGAGMAAEIAAVFEALVPLYDASVGA